ncbi:hypothetical protein M3Y95_00347400 [Aphelenchoides besseyi]|nr:hypothetical protein M3Y95_00347400 [Aphelenchoides besseyi]
MHLRLLLFAVLMFAGNILVRSDEGCLKQQESDLEIDGGACTELKPTTIKVKDKSLGFQFKYDSTTGLLPKKIELKVGGCTVDGHVAYGFAPGYFAHTKLGNTDFPVSFKASEDKLEWDQKSIQDCKPAFTPEGDYFTIKVEYKADTGEIPGFKIIFKDSELPGNIETAGEWTTKSWRLWLSIAGGLLIIALFVISIIGGVLWFKNLKKKLAPITTPLMPSVDTSTAKSTSMAKSKNEANEEKRAKIAKFVKENQWIKTWRWPTGTYKPEDIAFLRKTLEGPDKQLPLEIMLVQDPLNEQSIDALRKWLIKNNADVRGTCSNAEVLRLEDDMRLIMKILETREALARPNRKV